MKNACLRYTRWYFITVQTCTQHNHQTHNLEILIIMTFSQNYQRYSYLKTAGVSMTFSE